jgi:hypothetical protein
MKPLTDRQRQWVWFAALWCGGIVAALLLAYGAKWLVENT